MTAQATRSENSRHPTTGNGGAADLGFWIKANGDALQNWAQSSASMMKGAMGFAQEIMSFSQSRFQANVDSWMAFAVCRNPSNFRECQREFVEEATAQYLAEANKLSSKITSVMSSAANPFQTQQASQSPST
jgi:hypothetical protein